MACEPDVLVIGAGPAGALAALRCAGLGAAVLLVDKAAFPRPKVCGCCLNGSALATLDTVGLGGLVDQLGAPTLRELQVHARGRCVRLRLPVGRVVSREALDHALVRAAVAAGVALRERTRAVVRTDGGVMLSDGSRVLPGCIIVADGLNGGALSDHPAFQITVRPASRIGLGACLHDTAAVEPETIRMTCGERGYVGMVRLEDGRVDVAAAIEPGAVRDAGGAARAVGGLFGQAGVESPAGLHAARWRGTPALTRTRCPLWHERLFVVGDAAGYVEPFTGEGMAWAMAGGLAVAPLAVAAADRWDEALGLAWQSRHGRIIHRRQWACRTLAAALRRPALTAAAVAMLSRVPGLARPVIDHLNQPAAA